MIIGTFSYLSILISLRISGKRTLSKLNAFDFIVTVALGSVLATMITSKDFPLSDGIASFSILMFLQFLISTASVKWDKVEKVVKSEPSLLYYEGDFLYKTLKKERVTKDDIFYKIRESGNNDLEKILAVVLETDGSISVVKKGDQSMESSLKNLKID